MRGERRVRHCRHRDRRGEPDVRGRTLPRYHSRGAVELVVAAGATVVGKTITDELAYSLSGTNVHFGTPVNVAAPGRVPGGSSAGSAAAVADGLCDFALGTDTGGSIRVPASYCGLWGWRPTFGAVSADGVVHLARSFDTVGAFARSPELLARVADVLLDQAPDSSTPGMGSAVRVAELFAVADPDAANAVRDATDAWGKHDDVELGIDLTAAADAFRALQGREAWAEHGAWISGAHPALGPGIAERFATASRVTTDDVAAAAEVRAHVRQVIEAATAGGRILVGPAAVGAAPAVDAPADGRASHRFRTLQLTCLAGLAGAPVVVLPIAQVGGLPLGVACIGAPGTDRQLLRETAKQFAR